MRFTGVGRAHLTKREVKQEEKKVNKTINLQIGKLDNQPRSTRNTPQNIPQVKPKKLIEIDISKNSMSKRKTGENSKIAKPVNS